MEDDFNVMILNAVLYQCTEGIRGYMLNPILMVLKCYITWGGEFKTYRDILKNSRFKVLSAKKFLE